MYHRLFVVGCQNGVLALGHCSNNGWVYVAWKVKGTMTTTWDIVIHACSFIFSLVAGGMYEDIGVYNLYEMVFVSLFNTTIVLINAKIQAFLFYFLSQSLLVINDF